MSSIGFYFDMSTIVEDKEKTKAFIKRKAVIDKYLKEIRATEESKPRWMFQGITDNIPKVYE